MTDTDKFRQLARELREDLSDDRPPTRRCQQDVADAIDMLLAERDKMALVIAGKADPFIAISFREEIRTELIQSLARENERLRTVLVQVEDRAVAGMEGCAIEQFEIIATEASRRTRQGAEVSRECQAG